MGQVGYFESHYFVTVGSLNDVLNYSLLYGTFCETNPLSPPTLLR